MIKRVVDQRLVMSLTIIRLMLLKLSSAVVVLTAKSPLSSLIML
jgi:hypothetical protein